MNALRKPDYLTAAYKMAYLRSRLGRLTPEQFMLEFLLTDHVGIEGCFPSQETLVKEMRMSQTTVRRLRDQLAAQGEIEYVAGTGHRSTRYFLPGLAEHTAELKGKKASRVPKPPSEGATLDGTEPLPSSLNEKKDRPVLRLVQSTGWEALKMRAPDTDRRFWLDKLTLKGADPDGTIHLEAESSHVAEWVRNMLLDIGKLGTIARSVGIDPDKVKIRAPNKHGRDPYPADLKTVPLTRAGQEEMAEAIENKPDKPVLVAYAENTVSLEAYRTRRDDALRELDDGGVPVGDAEVAWPQQPDAGPERPHQGGDSGDGAGRTARQDAPCRDGGETQPGLETGGVSDRGTRDGGDRGTAPPPAQHQPAVPALEDTVTNPLGEHHEQHDDDDRPG